MQGKPLSGRLTFLDWSRGLAALVMLQGHVFHSFTSKDLREGSAYVLSQFIGGLTPAMFLFLTGVTFAFLMDSQQRKGVLPVTRMFTSLRRASYLFALAIVFRLQLWLFGWGQSPWTDLLKVDILNLMGFGLGLLSVLALLSTTARVRVGATVGALIAISSPLVSLVNWNATPGVLKMYLTPDANYFSFFPWAAFLAFGVSAGSVLRLICTEQLKGVMQWSMIIGLALVIGSQYASNIPYSLYPASDFWLNSPWLQFIKLGVILMIIPFAYLWTKSNEGWSWIRQLGTTSLLVYWVHIELVYGRWFGNMKESLTVPQTLVAAVLCILLMLALSVIRTNWNSIRPYLTLPRYENRRVSGD
jgi:uncharacterized membrane protein